MPRTSFTTPILVALLLALPTGVAAQEAQHLALITDLSGNVAVVRAEGSPVVARWGTQLFLGDQVRTMAEARVSILFSNNNLITLGPNSAVTISSGPATTAAPAMTVDRTLLASVSDLTLHRTGRGAISALGGLRSGGPTAYLEAQTPRSTKVLPLNPTFEWEARGSFEAYTVRLLSDEGLVWQGTTTDTRLAYPEDAPALEPGRSYYWQVTGEQMLDTIKSEMASFDVLTEEDRQQVLSGEAEIRALFSDALQSSSYQFVLGAFYAKEGLLDLAIDIFSTLAQTHPEAALPQEILAKLLLDVGMPADAALALQRAQELGQ